MFNVIITSSARLLLICLFSLDVNSVVLFVLSFCSFHSRFCLSNRIKSIAFLPPPNIDGFACSSLFGFLWSFFLLIGFYSNPLKPKKQKKHKGKYKHNKFKCNMPPPSLPHNHQNPNEMVCGPCQLAKSSKTNRLSVHLPFTVRPICKHTAILTVFCPYSTIPFLRDSTQFSSLVTNAWPDKAPLQ